jgi:ribulose-5-phosphate 4-epimerase/fuculose-1-phosphate aldolase
MAEKFAHQVLAGPLKCWAVNRGFYVSVHQISPNFCSITHTHSSASTGSSALMKSGGRVLENSTYVVSHGP